MLASALAKVDQRVGSALTTRLMVRLFLSGTVSYLRCYLGWKHKISLRWLWNFVTLRQKTSYTGQWNLKYELTWHVIVATVFILTWPPFGEQDIYERIHFSLTFNITCLSYQNLGICVSWSEMKQRLDSPVKSNYLRFPKFYCKSASRLPNLKKVLKRL